MKYLRQKSSSQKIKRLLLIKESWTSQVNKFSAFPSGKMQESGLTTVIPLIYTLTARASSLLLSILNPLRVYCLRWYNG